MNSDITNWNNPGFKSNLQRLEDWLAKYQYVFMVAHGINKALLNNKPWFQFTVVKNVFKMGWYITINGSEGYNLFQIDCFCIFSFYECIWTTDAKRCLHFLQLFKHNPYPYLLLSFRIYKWQNGSPLLLVLDNVKMAQIW